MGCKSRILGCIDSIEMAPASSQEISRLAAPNLRSGCLRQRAFRQTENVADLNVQCRSAKTRRTRFRMRSWRASCRKTTVRRGNDKKIHFADWHLHWQKTRQLTETVVSFPMDALKLALVRATSVICRKRRRRRSGGDVAPASSLPLSHPCVSVEPDGMHHLETAAGPGTLRAAPAATGRLNLKPIPASLPSRQSQPGWPEHSC